MKKYMLSVSAAILGPLILIALFLSALGGSHAITVLSEKMPLEDRRTVIIDAGHGGVDGGATSCTGILESHINLEIALRLDDLMHLLGYHTLMIRREDISVYTKGDTIAAKKVSDLKQRVKLVNEAENPILVSIHQNTFADRRYSGAQVFYGPKGEGQQLAGVLQSALIRTLNPGSNRSCKKGDGIYLLQNINCTGVLIECGFLSNPEEEARLRSDTYQRNLCCVIAATIGNYLDG